MDCSHACEDTFGDDDSQYRERLTTMGVNKYLLGDSDLSEDHDVAMDNEFQALCDDEPHADVKGSERRISTSSR